MLGHSRISPSTGAPSTSSPASEASEGSRLGRVSNGSFMMAFTKLSPRSRRSCGVCGGGVVANPRFAGSPRAARRASTAHAKQVSRRHRHDRRSSPILGCGGGGLPAGRSVRLCREGCSHVVGVGNGSAWDHTRFVGTQTRRAGVESRRLRTGEVVVVVD